MFLIGAVGSCRERGRWFDMEGEMALLAQVKEVERAFVETAWSYGLAVAILIAFALIVLVAIFFLVRWVKPLFEEVIKSHLLTMHTFRINSQEMVKSQVGIQSELGDVKKEIVDGFKRHSDAVRLNSAKLEDNSKVVASNTDALKTVCKVESAKCVNPLSQPQLKS